MLWLLIQTTPVQNWIVKRVTNKLSRDLHAKVSIRHVEFNLFNKMLLQDAVVLDRNNDTLLYAGTAKVNITDWFFLKNDIVLKYVSLDDALIHLHRKKDSTWNYQFLIDYFSSPAKKTDTSKNVVRLDLKTLQLNRVRILQQDDVIGENKLYSFDKMYLDADGFDMKNKTININSISLLHPLFAQYDYKLPGSNAVKKVLIPGTQGWNDDNWNIRIKNISIVDGALSIQKDYYPPPVEGQFDGQHILVSGMDAHFENIRLEKDTITASINLSAKDRSGVEIKKMTSNVKVTPKEMEFNDLDILTNRSHIKNYYVMRYENFDEDMGDFAQKVSLEANFTGSEINSDDIAFFAPGLKTWKRNFLVSGHTSGTIDNLSGKEMIIRGGNNIFFNGDVLLKGLSSSNDVNINLEARELQISSPDLTAIVPSLRKVRNPNIAALGDIRFTGKFSGFTSDFVSSGILTTSLGTVKEDLHMKLPANSPPVYSGKIETISFQLGRFLSDRSLGTVSFNGNVAGKGFRENNMDLSLDGTIKQFELDNYNYRNIIAKGNLKNNFFKGELSIDDPNLKINKLTGSIDFNAKEPRFNFNADVAHSNFKNLGLTDDNFSLTGKFELNFTGNNIDNFLGSAKIYDATLLDNDQKLSFDFLNLNSSVVNGRKFLSVQSREMDADILGNFRIMQLPDAFRLLLSRHYPSYITKPKRLISDQDFTFNIKTRLVHDYLGLLTKNLKGFDNSTLSGSLNLSSNSMDIKADIPSFEINNIGFNNVNFHGVGSYDTLLLSSNISDVSINDSLHLPDTRINVRTNNDISEINIKTSASRTLNEADFSGTLQTLPDGFKLAFHPSSFVINDKKWTLEKGGELVLNKKLLTATEVKFVQNDQQLIFSTEPSSTGNSNDVILEMKKIDLEDIVPFFIKSPRFEGLTTGNMRINDPFGNYSIDFSGQIDRFRFENDSIGVLKTSANYSSLSGELTATASSQNLLYNFITDITYKAKDSTGNQLNGSLNLDRSSIHFLQKYLTDIFSGLQGTATGQLNISGFAKDPKVTGSIALNDVSMTVNYTRCKYIFNNNTVIKFNKDEMDFGSLKIRDTLNNTATISGKIYHTFFDNFFFGDLKLKTDRKGAALGKFILLNTTSKDNKEFYGYMVGDAEMDLEGPITDMQMNITAQPTDSSHIYLPTGDVAETGNIDYIDFVKFGKEMRTDISARHESNIKVNMQVTATPVARIDVILDEITGDIIKARGSGKLNMTVGTKEPLLIRGRYDIEEGQYTFNFQTFLKTPFTLQSGFIEWQGDPYLANLNIDASYRATQVDLSNIPTSTGVNKTKGNVDVIFKLRGTLKDPRPDFQFVFPFDNPLRSDPIANEYLKSRYESDKNELNKQVTALLLFNSFMLPEQRLFTTSNTSGFVFRTVGQILSTTLSSSLSNWLQKLLKTNAINLYTNINTNDLNLANSSTQYLQNLGNFGFKTSFLKNRLLLNFGGNVDYRLIQSSSNSNTNFLFTPDVSFEYLITPGGGLRVVGFNRSDADFGDIAGVTRRNRTGVLLSYRKDFNTFNELFGQQKVSR